MGLQYRKRTKGKNSWLNFSKSGVSLSYKIGNLTFNSRGRSTMNLGNGFRYVAYAKKKRTAKPVKEAVYKRPKVAKVQKPKYTTQQLLTMSQQSIHNIVKMGLIKDAADLETIASIHDAISVIRQNPKSPDNRDLILIITNQFKELTQKTGNQTAINTAEVVSEYLRTLIVKRWFIPEFAPRKSFVIPGFVKWGISLIAIWYLIDLFDFLMR